MLNNHNKKTLLRQVIVRLLCLSVLTRNETLASVSPQGYNACHMESQDAYQQALDYLYSFVDFSLQRTNRYSADKFDLGRMVVLMRALGNPELDYPVIHVAGTKGKGSVASFCASALCAANFSTGLYTS